MMFDRHRLSRRQTTQCRFAAALVALGACGDDDVAPADAGSDADAAIENLCPTEAPDRDELIPPCCYRQSNADRLSAPEFRFVSLEVREPAVLDIANPLIRPNIDREVTNWLYDFQFDGTQVTMRTGVGSRNMDGSFAFGLPGYEPGMAQGTLTGSVVATEPMDSLLLIPLFDDDGVRLIVDLPLRYFSVVEATLSEDRNCIGTRRNRSAWDAGGSIDGYITLADSEAQGITFGPLNDTTLCMLLSGNGTMAGQRCERIPREDWPNPPNSICDGGDPETCTLGGCDPLADCNAWRVESDFTAAAVEIVD